MKCRAAWRSSLSRTSEKVILDILSGLIPFPFKCVCLRFLRKVATDCSIPSLTNQSVPIPSIEKESSLPQITLANFSPIDYLYLSLCQDAREWSPDARRYRFRCVCVHIDLFLHVHRIKLCLENDASFKILCESAE